MKTNVKPERAPLFTEESGPAKRINALAQLRRLVMSTMLWESGFYSDGVEIATAIGLAADKVEPHELAAVAIEARVKAHLRHTPLLLVDLLSERADGVAGAVASVLRRADEAAELLALHLKRRGLLNVNKVKTVPASIRKGIELAFQFGPDFGEYGLAKYDREAAVKLRDVIRLVHPKPLNDEQKALWKRALDGELKTPDTWEVGLSTGQDKREVFERLLREEKLGYLALLRNLRKMEEQHVDRDLIRAAILKRKGSARVLPFRYVAAARAAPSFEREIDAALVASIADGFVFSGTTHVLVDVSGSMNYRLSVKSDLTRMDAAAALASVINSDDLKIYTFSERMIGVAPRRGMAGVDAIRQSQAHSGTYLGNAITILNDGFMKAHDRLIVVTDEQTADSVPAPVPHRSYLINVASDKNGVGYGTHWTHIDGFSENVLRFIREVENQD
jgi:hypothetical protein